MRQTIEFESDLVLKLKKDGLVAIASIHKNALPEKLAELAVKTARGQYTDLKMIPAELVLNEGYSFENPVSHVAYGKISTEERRMGYEIIMESIVGPLGFDMRNL